jgi:Ca2+-binding EF-hand superfamily protein
MKTKSLMTLAALLGACTFATAQEQPPKQPRPQRQIPAELLKKYDADHDGKLSDSEREAMRADMKAANEKRQAEMLKKYDKDNDGKLSDEERKAMREDMQARRKALLEKYDANKDGKLDPSEIKTARDAGEDIPMMGRDGQRGQRGANQNGGRRNRRGNGAPAPEPAPAPAEGQ